jgi:hypothetical protein
VREEMNVDVAIGPHATSRGLTGRRVVRPRLAVVIPCSKTKASCPEAVATPAELAKGSPPLRLAARVVAAKDLYRGRQFRTISNAVDQLLVDRPDIELSLHVVSAGYGLLASGDAVVPYEATLGSARREWMERGRQLELPDRMKDLITSVDAAIIALGEAYLVACGLPHDWSTDASVLYLSPKVTRVASGTAVIWAGRREARALKASERDVRGRLLSVLLGRIGAVGMPALDSVPSDPTAWPEFAG